MNFQNHNPTNSPKKRSRFTPDEDQRLKSFVESFGTRNWSFISSMMQTRNPRQCKERWELFLSPKVEHREWTKEEDELLLLKRHQYGSQWILICLSFPKRTDVSLKNRWKHLQKIQKEKEQEHATHEVMCNFSDINSIEQFEIEPIEFDFYSENEISFFSNIKFEELEFKKQNLKNKN
jgi:hypothetical protein